MGKSQSVKEGGYNNITLSLLNHSYLWLAKLHWRPWMDLEMVAGARTNALTKRGIICYYNR